METIEIEQRFGIGFCRKLPLVIERGAGTYVWDEQGRRFLDFTSGWGVTCLGHSHPVITAAITAQAGRLMQNPNSGFTYSSKRSQLLELLHGVLPAGLARSFFVNSGAEANDVAIKLARKITGRPLIVSTRESFHGRTYGTLSVSGGESQVRRFRPGESGTRFVPYGDRAAVASVLDESVAAVIVEPVQGEGGVRIPPSGYLADLAALCRQQGSFLIVDEIQTGFGRTGKLFAIEHGNEPVMADFLTMGKGLAGGFPFAALAVTESVASRIEAGDHGGTYAGNPLGCAVATAVIDYLVANDIPARARHAGALLLDGLQTIAGRHPGLVREVRGLGLLCALELQQDDQVWPLAQACLDVGLLITPTRAGIVRLIPDLLVEDTEIGKALELLDSALTAIGGRVAADSPAGVVCGSASAGIGITQ